MDFKNKKVIVLGAGISGFGIAKVAKQLGAITALSDAKPENEIKYDLDELRQAGISVMLGKQTENMLEGLDYLIVSPGIPIGIPLIQAAKARGISVMSEVEAAYRLCKVPLYAITGTNGKTTTTVLLGEFMKTLHKNVGIGGNIGTALSTEAVRVGLEGCVVAEISSYQLEGVIDFHPKIAAILNVTPDHIARHGSLEKYQQVKETIFAHQDKNDYLVLNYDDPRVKDMAQRTNSTVFFFSTKQQLTEGAYVEDNNLVVAWQGRKQHICSIDDMKIKGSHNVENALAAAGMAYLAGADLAKIAEVLRDFPGVEHRIEPVRVLNGVSYYNDSKATNPESAIKALDTFADHIILIAGGHDKNTDLTEFMELVCKKVDQLILVGNAAARFKEAALNHGFSGMNIHEVGYSMKEAVTLACTLAKEPQVVLLSPGCASFDMFDGFEERGRVFKDLVSKLS